MPTPATRRQAARVTRWSAGGHVRDLDACVAGLEGASRPAERHLARHEWRRPATRARPRRALLRVPEKTPGPKHTRCRPGMVRPMTSKTPRRYPRGTSSERRAWHRPERGVHVVPCPCATVPAAVTASARDCGKPPTRAHNRLIERSGGSTWASESPSSSSPSARSCCGRRQRRGRGVSLNIAGIVLIGGGTLGLAASGFSLASRHQNATDDERVV